VLRALRAEITKLRRSAVPLWTALVVVIAPLVTVSSVTLVRNGAEHATWLAFMRAGPQLLAGWYGTVLFGMVTAYVFGREYADGTVTALHTLPLDRGLVVCAKMVVVLGWALALTFVGLVAQAGYAAALGLAGSSWADAASCLGVALRVTALICATMPLVALVAMIGRGYLAPMVFATTAAALGIGLAEGGFSRYFPWSMPVAVSGMALFPAVPLHAPTAVSWVLMGVLFAGGLGAAIVYADRADTLG
jgi:ABC-2 type transport system permease protein